ncbi:iron-sulfur cluster assembly scaffold protein [Candidatus Woesearchaeota archaeon]|nr:iron-sulfur cluster assembly scaffold protein [Candidatus Woesearchaeota archaeon]
MQYSDKVIEHFQKPHNMGEIKDANAIGKVGNPVCGDLMWIYIKVDKNEKEQEIIKDIGFKTFGCVAAIATSSMVTDLAKGKTLEEASKLTRKEVSKALGNLPPVKEHCSNLAAEGLHKAIENYKDNVPVDFKVKQDIKCKNAECCGGKTND